jgi:hypothetical protein
MDPATAPLSFTYRPDDDTLVVFFPEGGAPALEERLASGCVVERGLDGRPVALELTGATRGPLPAALPARAAIAALIALLPASELPGAAPAVEVRGSAVS